MFLYLIQHGRSFSKEQDPERPLSDEGKVETELMANYLKNKIKHLDSIWHSQKLRSTQTAKIISEALGKISTLERNDINPLDPVSKLPEELKGSNKDIMIVGHLPFLQKLASKLLTGDENQRIITFTYSCTLCLSYQDEWSIQWFLIPALLQ